MQLRAILSIITRFPHPLCVNHGRAPLNSPRTRLITPRTQHWQQLNLEIDLYSRHAS